MYIVAFLVVMSSRRALLYTDELHALFLVFVHANRRGYGCAGCMYGERERGNRGTLKEDGEGDACRE